MLNCDAIEGILVGHLGCMLFGVFWYVLVCFEYVKMDENGMAWDLSKCRQIGLFLKVF